jgi:GGDEF domain-containing protein
LPEAAPGDGHLQALESLVAGTLAHPEELFDQGLGLLVRQLGVDRAMVATLGDGRLDSLWCADGEGGLFPPFSHDPNLNFCPLVLGGAGPTLAIGDAEADPEWSRHSGWRVLKVRAYLGAELRDSAKATGVLSVQSDAPRAWRPADVALVRVMAFLFSQAMELEALKAGLFQAREVMDLTAAVIEDHALEDARSGLPTQRYLDVWCKSHLKEARRRREVIALAVWTQPPAPDRGRLMARLAGSLRGVDLVVDLGRDRFLLVLPRTQREGADLVLQRARTTLGVKAMGATLWNPLLNPDRDAATLQPAIRRAQLAVPPGLEADAPEADDGGVAWTLLKPSRANILGESDPW